MKLMVEDLFFKVGMVVDLHSEKKVSAKNSTLSGPLVIRSRSRADLE